MAKKGKRAASLANAPEEITNDAHIEEDNRPETSPYGEPACIFSIGQNGVNYTVPQLYAKQSPKWSFQNNYYYGYHSDPRTIELPEVDGDIGHTLVHFLYTGSYQTLKPKGASGPPDSKTEYRRAVLVYFAARSYELDDLATHAMSNMELFDKELSIFDILDIAKDVYPMLLEDEIWFRSHLKRKMELAFEADETIFAQEQFSDYFGEVAAFSKALLKIVVDIYAQKVTNMAKNECKSRERLFGNAVNHEAPVTDEAAKDFPPPQEEFVKDYPSATPPPSQEEPVEEYSPSEKEPVEEYPLSQEELVEDYPPLEQELVEEYPLSQEAPVEEYPPKAEEIVEDYHPPPEQEHTGPDFSVLDGLKIDEFGHIRDSNGELIGRLVEAKAYNPRKNKYTCDAEGNVWRKGKRVKGPKVELVKQEKAAEEEMNPHPPVESAEPWLEEAVFVVPSPPPSISQSSLCSLRAQHVLGDGWKDCEKCRAMIRQVTVQLAQEEGNLDKNGVDAILLR